MIMIKQKLKIKLMIKQNLVKKKECINKRNEFWLKWYFFILISSLIFFFNIDSNRLKFLCNKQYNQRKIYFFVKKIH
jgi:hypothetical protein